jgi:hypothetical protein
MATSPRGAIVHAASLPAGDVTVSALKVNYMFNRFGKFFQHTASALKLSGLILMISTQDAHAYVDPGSGSIIVTTVLGVIAAVGYTMRKFFYKLRRTLFGSKTELDDDQE